MGLFGSLVKLGFGGPPKLLEWQDTNVQRSQDVAVAGNTAQLPQTIANAETINAAQQAMLDKLLAQASGGVYARLRDKNLANVEDLLEGGDITDVLRGTAAANLARGVAGTNFGMTTALKNSADRVQANKAAGFNSLERWLAGARALYQPVDIGTMFLQNSIRPEFQAQFDYNQNTAKLGYTNLKKQFKYATDPMRGVEESVAGFADVIGTALMAYMGGGIGGAAGGGGMMGGLGGMMGMGGGGGAGSAMQMLSGFFGQPGAGGGGANTYGAGGMAY